MGVIFWDGSHIMAALLCLHYSSQNVLCGRRSGEGIFIKLPRKREFEKEHLCLDIRLPVRDHISGDLCVRLEVRTLGSSTAPPTSQHLHACNRETGASTHPLLPTNDHWGLRGRDQEGLLFYRDGLPQHLGDRWEGYSLIAYTANRDWAIESRTPDVPNPYHSHTALYDAPIPNLDHTYTNPILHYSQIFTSLEPHLPCICCETLPYL